MARSCRVNSKIKQHEKMLCLYGKNIAFIETIYKILLAKNLVIVRHDAHSKIEFIFGKMNALFQIIATIHDSNYMKYKFYGDEVKKMVKEMMGQRSFNFFEF
uniref:Uncharacterized protein n=1 Tax=Globodera rostochiensis TaxID=31243 RepID=A0A914IFI4_GLORO